MKKGLSWMGQGQGQAGGVGAANEPWVLTPALVERMRTVSVSGTDCTTGWAWEELWQLVTPLVLDTVCPQGRVRWLLPWWSQVTEQHSVAHERHLNFSLEVTSGDRGYCQQAVPSASLPLFSISLPSFLPSSCMNVVLVHLGSRVLWK